MGDKLLSSIICPLFVCHAATHLGVHVFQVNDPVVSCSCTILFWCRYAFLIDSSGLVRWRGSGKAELAEVDSLLRAADQLLQ